jgi:2'-5' RNA ligase
VELQARLPPELRPIHPQDLHLTVAYFGRIDPALHPPLLEALGAITFDPVEVRLATVMALRSRERPTAITLTLSPGPGRDALIELMIRQRPALAAVAGVDAETHPPLPHITFARPRGRQMTAEKRDAILAWIDSVAPLDHPVTLGAPALMRALPPGARSGPYYEVIRP